MKVEPKRRSLMEELADASAAVDAWSERDKALRDLSLRAEEWFRDRHKD